MGKVGGGGGGGGIMHCEARLQKKCTTKSTELLCGY